MYKILVITDGQVDFITGPLGNEECQAVVPQIVDIIEKGDYDLVYLTQDTHDDNYLNTQEGKKLPIEHTKIGTKGWKIVDEIVATLKEKYKDNYDTTVYFIEKTTFGSKNLMNRIESNYNVHKHGLQIDFVGVCTGICVISNVLPIKMVAPEATIRVVEKACADVTPEDHKRAIEAMRHCQVDIVEE